MMTNFQFIRNRSDFHQKRSKTIGSSDIPVLLNLYEQYKTPYQLWKEKTGRVFNEDEEEKEQSAPAALGHAIEGIILSREIEELTDKETAHKFRIDYYTHEYKRPADWKPKTDFIPFSFSVYADDKRFTASPDCVWDAENKRIIESKLGSRFANIRSSKQEDGYDIDDPTEHGLPMRVFVQCQWQSLVYGIEDITVRALLDSVFESRHEFKANRKIQEKLMLVADNFLWHVKHDKPPSPTSSKEVVDMYDNVQNKTLLVGGNEEKELRQYFEEKKRWQAVAKKAKKEIEANKAALAIKLADKQYLQTPNGDILAQRVIKKATYPTVGVQKILDNAPEAFEILNNAGLIPEKKGTEYIL
jgi:predicted phage-related endonuclease